MVDRSVDVEALGLAALFEVEPRDVDAEHGWPARCAPELRGAGRLVAWIGSREPHFVRRLTALVPGAVVAPSVGSDRRAVWRHLLDTIGASTANGTLRVPVLVPAPLVAEARLALRRAGWDGQARLLAVHPGAGGRGKRWPTSGFAAVLERLVETLPRLAVVIHRGPADSEAVAALASRLTHEVMVLEEPQLPLLAGALSFASAYLGNDSGISHLAAALAVPSVLLFAAERMIWEPWAERLAPQVVSMPTVDEADVARVIAALLSLLG